MERKLWKYISKSVDDRECSTTISPSPLEKLLNAMDKIVEDQVEEIIDMVTTYGH